MRILVVALGTMGDVAPYTGLAARLQAGGHEVAIGAYPRFAELVRAAGVEFLEMPGDPTVIGEWTQAESGSQALRGMRATELERGKSIIEVAQRGKPDVLLLSLPAAAGIHVAESLGIPSIGVFLGPVQPTVAHPPIFAGMSGSLGPWGNRAANLLVYGLLGALMSGATKQLRSSLGLRALNRRERNRQMGAMPVLHGVSPSVLPRPADWPQTLEMSGYFWPSVAPDWQPPADLVEFLAAGPPPVFVSFGSRRMSQEEEARIAGLVDEALRQSGTRGVIQAGWSGLSSRSESTITIGPTPHEWLFPRMAAVVHHAGAGTTAAGLRAGVPAVCIPILGDQPFWAGRVAALGAGPAPIPYKKLSAEALADAISSAVSRPAYREAAEALSRRIAAEDGAGNVLAAIDRLAERTGASERT